MLAEWWNEAEADNGVEKRLVTIPVQEDKGKQRHQGERHYPSSMHGFLAKSNRRTGGFCAMAYDALDYWQVLLMAPVLGGWEAPPTRTHTYR